MQFKAFSTYSESQILVKFATKTPLETLVGTPM
jgi:hypothetical protein